MGRFGRWDRGGESAEYEEEREWGDHGAFASCRAATVDFARFDGVGWVREYD